MGEQRRAGPASCRGRESLPLSSGVVWPSDGEPAVPGGWLGGRASSGFKDHSEEWGRHLASFKIYDLKMELKLEIE